MTRRITIRNLKHIKELTFDIPGAGVYLLTGQNGSGKTSLLACLRRIGDPYAFATHFRASQRSESLDNFENTTIEYTIDDRNVIYAYAGERWVPRPRRNNQLLRGFGYPTVLYIGAIPERITPRTEDFRPRRLTTAPQQIRDAANRIFGTTKFNALKIINLTRGAGNPAFVMEVKPAPEARYYSEGNFSLGELCILKLIRDIRECDDNSLLLIDELELALHPKAQAALLSYLRDMAAEKHLTIIFSTHSVTLLKRMDRKHILFLENSSGSVRALRGCYPAYALGNIADDEERALDLIVYVEDFAAQAITDGLIRLCIAARFQDGASLYPSFRVIPLGPFDSVIRFLPGSRAMFPASTRSFALLDTDVRTETIATWHASNNHERLAEYQAQADRIGYLPWTPEVGLVTYLQIHRADVEQAIREHYHDHRLSIRLEDIGAIPGAAGVAQRQACKTAIGRIVSRLATLLPDETEDDILKKLYLGFAESYFQNHRNDVMELIMPFVA